MWWVLIFLESVHDKGLWAASHQVPTILLPSLVLVAFNFISMHSSFSTRFHWFTLRRLTWYSLLKWPFSLKRGEKQDSLWDKCSLLCVYSFLRVLHTQHCNLCTPEWSCKEMESLTLDRKLHKYPFFL